MEEGRECVCVCEREIEREMLDRENTCKMKLTECTTADGGSSSECVSQVELIAVRTEISAVRAEMASVRSELTAVRSEMERRVDQLHSQLHTVKDCDLSLDTSSM